MSSSRRDFFSTLASAVLALLGWRPRPTSAAPTPKPTPPAPVTSYPYTSCIYPAQETRICTYDPFGRVSSFCWSPNPTPPSLSAEQGRPSDDATG